MSRQKMVEKDGVSQLKWLILLCLCLGISGQLSAACIDEMTLEPALDKVQATDAQLDQLVQYAEQALTIGYRRQAIEILNRAAYLAMRRHDVERQVITVGALGNSLLMAGSMSRAQECLQQNRDLAEELGKPDLIAIANLNWGNLHFLQDRDRRRAEEGFGRAIAEARKVERWDIVVKARLNRARVLTNEEGAAFLEDAEQDLLAAEQDLAEVKDESKRASLWLALGLRWTDLLARYQEHERFAQKAHLAFGEALGLARQYGLDYLEAKALGELGRLYAQANRPDDALDLFYQAETLARDLDAPIAAYPWSWQIAQLLDDTRDREGALKAYRRAVGMVEDIRRNSAELQGLSEFTPSVLDDAQAILTEYVELLFADGHAPSAVQELEDIQDVVEQQRQVEIETYLQDDCIADLQGRTTKIDRVLESRTALIYPIQLDQRTILLVRIGDQSLLSYAADVTSKDLDEHIEALRKALTDRNTDASGYYQAGQTLYEKLIAPVVPMLEQNDVDTLVFVPSSALRAIPFAALHDGANFLVRSYAVVTAPSLELLGSARIADVPIQALIGGLTEATPGYLRLPNVALELERIGSAISVGDVLTDEAFVPDNLEDKLKATPYSVVHIASHATFGRTAAKSFIVTHDGEKLDLDRLESLLKPSAFREQPVELLTLSACKTADGGDQSQAALGLAGIAVKAGARSALGTLWPVYDASSPEIMAVFYNHLASTDPGMTKAKALQKAQLSLIDGQDFTHPVYWAPYVLIGNWL